MKRLDDLDRQAGDFHKNLKEMWEQLPSNVREVPSMKFLYEKMFHGIMGGIWTGICNTRRDVLMFSVDLKDAVEDALKAESSAVLPPPPPPPSPDLAASLVVPETASSASSTPSSPKRKMGRPRKSDGERVKRNRAEVKREQAGERLLEAVAENRKRREEDERVVRPPLFPQPWEVAGAQEAISRARFVARQMRSSSAHSRDKAVWLTGALTCVFAQLPQDIDIELPKPLHASAEPAARKPWRDELMAAVLAMRLTFASESLAMGTTVKYLDEALSLTGVREQPEIEGEEDADVSNIVLGPHGLRSPAQCTSYESRREQAEIWLDMVHDITYRAGARSRATELLADNNKKLAEISRLMPTVADTIFNTGELLKRLYALVPKESLAEVMESKFTLALMCIQDAVQNWACSRHMLEFVVKRNNLLWDVLTSEAKCIPAAPTHQPCSADQTEEARFAHSLRELQASIFSGK